MDYIENVAEQDETHIVRHFRHLTEPFPELVQLKKALEEEVKLPAIWDSLLQDMRTRENDSSPLVMFARLVPAEYISEDIHQCVESLRHFNQVRGDGECIECTEDSTSNGTMVVSTSSLRYGPDCQYFN